VANPEHASLRANLMICPSGRAEWRPLTSGIPDDGFYLWDTRSHSDGAYDLRVVVSDGLSLAAAVIPQPVFVANRPNHPPRVVLVSPSGGEFWSGTREVAWRASDPDGDSITATLYLSSDGGKVWTPFATLEARNGHYPWDTRQVPPGREYQMRIVVSDQWATSEDRCRGAFRLGDRQNHPPQVIFTSPDAQGKLLRGDIVTWIAEDVDDGPLAISLAISDDDGASWRDVADSLFNSGEYVLDSAGLKPGQLYRLRLRASDGVYQVQILSRPFKLARLAEQRPDLTITSPRGGERWSSTEDVRWQASDSMGQSLRIDVELSQDGGQSWTSVVQGLDNIGSYLWDTRNIANGTYLLRITADNGQSRNTEVSEPFVLDNVGRNAPVISVISPRGGDVWSGTREVKWRAFDADGDPITTSLAYSLDMGATWQSLAQGVANTTSYIWDTTTIPNSSRVWLRATASDGRFLSVDLSDGPFAVRNPHAPLVALLSPQDDEQWTGVLCIAWASAQLGSRPVKAKLETSVDAGQTWKLLAADLPCQGNYAWDTAGLAENTQVMIRVSASDGVQSAVDLTARPITVRGNQTLPGLPFYLP
jgi:hypothetical protein